MPPNTNPATTAASASLRPRRAAAGGTSRPRGVPASSERSAEAKSAAVAGARFAGSFTSSPVIKSARGSGTKGFASRTGFGVSRASAVSTANTESPTNARRPAANS